MRKYLVIVVFASSIIRADAQYNKIFDFTGVNGESPYGDFVFDGTFLYGNTYSGGTSTNCYHGCGTVFKVKPDGTAYSQLIDFDGGLNGGEPYGSLYYDGSFLYGTTMIGGTNSYGTIFKIKTNGTGDTVIFNFNNTNGESPVGTLISDGTFLYCMTQFGGINNFGSILKIKPDGTGDTTLLSFDGLNGKTPRGSMIFDGAYLYGMTSRGGIADSGVVFKIKTDGTGYAKLLDFSGLNGAYPNGSFISDGAFLYGMTSSGGVNNGGIIFKIKPDGTLYTKLHDFSYFYPDGSFPQGSLLFDSTYIYGLTSYGGNFADCYGVLFRMNSDGSGYNKLFNFDNTSSAHPYGSLISDGTSLYGMTSVGGQYYKGTVFKWNVKEIRDSIYEGCNLLSAIPYGGTPPYSFFWSNGDTTSSIYSSDTISVTITDSHGYFRVDTLHPMCLTAIKQSHEKNQISLYPNPTTTSFTITSSSTKIKEIKVINVLGEVVYQSEINNTQSEINTSQLTKGIYFVQILDENKNVVNRKVLIQ